ncbi:MAG: hypothetical protein LUD27_05695 [Clostridia bacterium]|nr:hypothetical protein [Clostridia bacterium]
MTKLKKISAAVVSVLLASTMCLGIAACDDNPSDSSTDVSTTTSDVYATDISGVTLNLQVGHNSTTTSTSFLSLGDNLTLSDGNTYAEGDMKPTWDALADALGIAGFNDVYQGKDTSANLSNATQAATSESFSWSNTDIITSDLSEITSTVSKGTSILNLGEYLDQMPNFKAYLEANPVVEYSIVSDVDGDDKVIYVAPYFDGNDDIERYVIARQDWVDILLGKDSALSSLANGDTWASASKSSGATAVSSYMQQTGTLAVEITDTTNKTSTTTIYKNYANVLTEIADSTSELYAAYYDIASTTYSGTSGNIVDIQNKALEVNSSATGKQLVRLVRAYIDACYTTTSTGSTSYYEDPADLFNGVDAAWDVDDLVALLRCVITNSANLCAQTGGTATGIFTRTALNDRTPDIVRLAGQLYGVRGVDSRYEYTYIDASGKLQSALNDEELWTALDNMHDLYTEGLVYNGNYDTTANADGATTTLKGGNSTEGFMMYDYVQTQTLYGFYLENGLTDPTGGLPDDYDFSPILNPLSKWSVNGTDDVTMRFTESWRSVKTSGIAINGAVADDPAKLAACLKFVDYIFSNDGHILMTYGPMATEAGNAETSNGGFWYNDVATEANITEVATLDEVSGQYTIKDEYKSQYFVYQNKVYTGTYYKGYTTPTLTTATINSFLGTSTAGKAIAANTNTSNATLNFTNYARKIIGSTLPVAEKDQCFEYQLTSEMGKAGADNVSDALVNGAIKGMTLSKESSTGYWYMVVPTGLPLTDLQSTTMSGQITLLYITGTAATSALSSSKAFYSVMQYVVINGLDGGTYTSNDQSWITGSSASAMVTNMVAAGSQTREDLANSAWQQLVTWYNI